MPIWVIRKAQIRSKQHSAYLYNSECISLIRSWTSSHTRNTESNQDLLISIESSPSITSLKAFLKARNFVFKSVSHISNISSLISVFTFSIFLSSVEPIFLYFLDSKNTSTKAIARPTMWTCHRSFLPTMRKVPALSLTKRLWVLSSDFLPSDDCNSVSLLRLCSHSSS